VSPYPRGCIEWLLDIKSIFQRYEKEIVDSFDRLIPETPQLQAAEIKQARTLFLRC
jgi:hypothetical protein